MAAVSQKIGNLIGGVSQQPDTNKYNGQLRICDNYYPDAATGLTKRPGLKGIGKLANAVSNGTWFHVFRDNNEKYIFQFSKAGALKVWNVATGLQQTVNTVAAEATAYAVHQVSADLEILQINDYTFVLNRNITVAQGSTSSDTYLPFGFVNINTVAFNTDYTITIDSATFSWTTPSNASGSTQNSVQTIINGLVTAINAAAGTPYNAQGIGNTIFIRRVNNADFNLKATGGTAGSAVEAFKEVVTSVSQLPREFISGRRIRVEGTAESNSDDYWVEFIPSTTGQTSGVGHWQETIAPGTILGMDTTTLPHVIIREANGTFTYRQLDEASATLSSGTSGGLSTVTRASGSTTATVTCTSAHNLTSGTTINVISGVAAGNYSITVLTTTTFTITTVATTALTAVNFVFTAALTSVTGIPTVVSIVSATSGGHVVGEEFSPTGGAGSNLSLSVASVKTDTVTNTYAANSTSYVAQVKISKVKYYHWYLNNVKIGETLATVSSLTIGDTTYTVNGAFQIISSPEDLNQLRAGIISTQVTTGVIDSIAIVQAGQGYSAANIVYNSNNDSFQINTVTTQNLGGDAFRLNYWKNRAVGDSETNPFPSFVNNTIDGISFYKNRIIFTSRQNVVCSQAGDYFNFFASTVITIVDSDPIDLSASSLKPIHLKHLLPIPRGLLMFGDNGQYVLETTTEAFAPKTAEVNLLSTYGESDTVSPVDIGLSFLFVEEGVKAATIFEMDVKDNIGNKPAVVELTRLIPTYIPSAITRMKNSSSTGTVAILSKQELSSLYLFRFFQQGETRISGWFRWNLPGTIESFDFDQDVLYVVTKHNSNYVLSSMSLLTDNPSDSLLFEGQYLDVRLDLFDYKPTLVYKSATNTTRVCFKDGFEDTNEQSVLMYLNSDVAGYFEEQTLQYDAGASTGEKYYLVAEGNQTAAGGLSTVTRVGGTTLATITCTSAHKLVTGNTITVIAGVLAGNYTVTVLSTTTFTITTVATTALSAINFIFSCALTAAKFAVGYKYEALAQLPAFYLMKDEARALKDTLNIPRISRITVNSYNSGPYKAIVRANGRDEFELYLPQITANNYNANNIPIIRNAQSNIPILAKGDQFEFELIADSPFPTAFTSLNWEGTYNNKGVTTL